MVDLALAIFTALPVALAALAVYGLGTSTGAVTFNSLLQAHIPEHARGRIFASFDMLWQLGRLISLLLGGLLAAWLGIQSVYYLGGLLLLWPPASDGRACAPPVLSQTRARRHRLELRRYFGLRSRLGLRRWSSLAAAHHEPHHQAHTNRAGQQEQSFGHPLT
ncbi:MAG: MFS transporter, partial [Actinomycetota bacterium]|nr:MFS transporter [Actinomycetota bacterium]